MKADSAGEGSYGKIFDKVRKSVNISGVEKLNFVHTFSGDNGAWVSDANVITYGAWHFVVVTYDNSLTTNNPIFYVDAQSVTVNESTTPTGTADLDAAASSIIGNNTGATRTFDGHIAEVMVFNRILSAEEVQRMYRAPSESPTFQAVTVLDSLGVGLASPTDRLIVKSSGHSTNPLQIQNNDGNLRVWFTQDSDGDYNLNMRDSAGNTDIALKTNAASYFNGGNVGIGTASPLSQLEIEASTSPRIALAVNSTRRWTQRVTTYDELTGSGYGGYAYVIGKDISTNQGHFLIQQDTDFSISKTGDVSMGADASVVGDLEVGDDLIVTAPTVPGSAGATGTVGMISWDSSYIYICIATNTWKRVAIATW